MKIILTALFFSFITLGNISHAQTAQAAQTTLSTEAKKTQLVEEINELFRKLKKWDFERMTVDKELSLKYYMCLSPECNPYVSWDFNMKNILPMKVGKYEEYTTIDFACKDGIECIVPTGYEKGGRYEPKKEFQLFINDKKLGKTLVEKLNQLQAMN